MAVLHHNEIETAIKVFPQLTRDQAQILILYSLGMGIKEIGEEVGIKTNTVGTHLANIRGRLNVDSAFELKSIFMCGLLLHKRKYTSSDLLAAFSELSHDEVDALYEYAIYAKDNSLLLRIAEKLECSRISTLRARIVMRMAIQ